jgi:hypothetical protein
MTRSLTLSVQENYALIVCTPAPPQGLRLTVQTTLLDIDEICKQARNLDYVPCVESPGHVLCEYGLLSVSDRQKRDRTLQRLRVRYFTAVHISGNGISPYVREITRLADIYRVPLFVGDIEPHTPLEGYLRWFRRSIL